MFAEEHHLLAIMTGRRSSANLYSHSRQLMAILITQWIYSLKQVGPLLATFTGRGSLTSRYSQSVIYWL